MESFTGPPADLLLKQSGVLKYEGNVHLLDSACGFGLVTSRLFEALPSKDGVKVVCGDLEPNMLDAVQARMEREGWSAETKIVDAQAIPFPDDTFTHVATCFGFQLFPDAQLALRETNRVLQPGGKSSITTWASVGWLALVLAAVPTFPIPPIFTGDWAKEESIRDAYAKAGFVDVKIEVLEFSTPTSVEHQLEMMRGSLAEVLDGEAGERYLKLGQEKYGEGDFQLPGWKALIATGTKA
ncbi:hypothetical protein RQP46_004799 [Phenoliferia psychrophenolica]